MVGGISEQWLPKLLEELVELLHVDCGSANVGFCIKVNVLYLGEPDIKVPTLVELF